MSQKLELNRKIMSKTSTIKICAGYETVNPIFHLRRITQREEREFFASLADFAQHDDPDAKDAHEYDCLTESLKAWSAGRLTKGEGDGTALFFDEPKADASADIDRYLSDVSSSGENPQRLVKDIVSKYMARLQPTVIFW
jgi:hypothetical protein